MTGTVVIVIVLVLALVAGLGLLIFRLLRRAQDVVPRVADGDAATRERIVAVEADGSTVSEADDLPIEAQRDTEGFERVLAEESDALHRRGDGGAAR